MHAVETFFTQENGGRRGHPRVMMVIIDGWPSDDLEQAALLARESGINVFLVSVAKAAPEELAMVQDKDFMKKVPLYSHLLSFVCHEDQSLLNVMNGLATSLRDKELQTNFLFLL